MADAPKFEDTMPHEDDVPKFEDTTEAPSFDDTAPVEAPHAPVSKSESLLRGAGNAATAGFGDEATGGIGGLYDYLMGKLGKRGDISLEDAYKTRRDSVRKRDEEAAKDNPKTYTAGQMGGSALLAAAPGMGALNAGKGAGLAEVAGKSALQGAASGLGESDSDSIAGDLENTAKGAALGGMMGTVGYGAGQLVGKGADALSDILKSKASSRAVKALEPILSQQELMNRKGTADALGAELLDSGVVKAGRDVKGMLPKLQELLGNKGAEIGAIRQAADEAAGGAPSIDLKRLADKGDAMSAFTDASDTATQNMAKAYSENAGNLAKVPNRTVGETQDLVSSLSDQIPFKKALADMTPEQQALRELRGDLVGQVDDRVRQNVPDQSGRYQDLKSQFGLLKDGEDILNKATARKSKNADLGLRDMLAATATDGSGLKKGAAALAMKLARERGNSTAAAGLDKLAGILSTNPDQLGKFAGVIQGAAARGGPALEVTHQMLMQDPEYRAMVGAK